MDLAASFLESIQEGLTTGTGIVPQDDTVEAKLYDWNSNRLDYQVPPHEDWTLWLFIAGRGTGKALALDTIIPTPSGWTTMGELQVGDQVFDDQGQICNVTATFETFAKEPYRITFSDGTEVDACEDHQWVTHLRGDGAPSPTGWTRTTKQIFETFYLSGTWWDEVRRLVAFDCAEDEATVCPYHFIKNALPPGTPGASSNEWWTILEMRRIDPQPMKCISVDSPSCMYLITKAMIPTHNTRTGAETVRAAVESGEYRRIGIIGATAADTRDVIVEGESGILAISPPWFKPEYSVTKRQLTWPNGAIAKLYSADEPGRLNGPQHDFIWADELGIWRRPEAWDMAMLGLRLGQYPRAIVTTTPKTSMKVRKLIDKARIDKENGNPSHYYYTRASTYQNPFLPDIFFAQIKEEYEGTRLERSEIFGEILDDAPGAIFQQAWIDGARVYQPPPIFNRVVVAVDPSGSANKNSDLAGIVVAGRASDKRIYIIEDASGLLKPDEWAERSCSRYHQWEADAIVAERNYGGDMVEAVIKAHDRRCHVETVWASRGKVIRAEPVAQLYQKGMVCHVGLHLKLETELTQWEPGNPSPNRMDALVWAVYALGVGAPGDWRCAYSKVRPQLAIARHQFGY